MNIKVNESVEMRSLTPKDSHEVYTAVDNNREYLREWLPWVDESTSEEETQTVIISWEDKAEIGSDFVFGVFKEGRYIGNIGLHGLKSQINQGEIGYWLAAAEQGGGVMTSCVKSLINYGFESLGLNRICIRCSEMNSKSRAIPERLGFVQEGILRETERLHGKYMNMVIYGMLRREWKG